MVEMNVVFPHFPVYPGMGPMVQLVQSVAGRQSLVLRVPKRLRRLRALSDKRSLPSHTQFGRCHHLERERERKHHRTPQTAKTQ